jgi:hypothetical protein
MVAHNCNPSYSGGEGRRITVWTKVIENLSQKASWMWWYMPAGQKLQTLSKNN